MAAVLAFSCPARADVLIDNVNGLTLDAKGRAERFNGVLVGDDGRIEQVLERGDKRPGKVDYHYDGKGRVLLPGLVDSHVDLMKLGLSLLKPDVPASASPGERKLPPPRPEDMDIAFANAQRLLLEHGITAVADMGTTIESWQAYRRAGDLGDLRIRIAAYANGTEAMALIGGPGPTPWLYGDRLRLNGVSLVLDGSLESHSAALKAPYSDASPAAAPKPASSRAGGEPRYSDTQLKNLMSRAAIDNFQVAVRAEGDSAVANVLDAIDELSETYQGDRRWRIEQAVIVDPADMPRLGQHGIAISVRPGMEAPLREIAEARLGSERLTGAFAWKSLADAGATLAFGSDTPQATPQPFAGMAAAITRQDANGLPFGGWQPQDSADAYEGEIGDPELDPASPEGRYQGAGFATIGHFDDGPPADAKLAPIFGLSPTPPDDPEKK